MKKTWLVADLNTKFEIQKLILNKNKWLPEDAVLRASDFWKKILSVNDVDLNIISPSLARSLLLEWLREQKIPWANPNTSATVLEKYIKAFLPIFISEQDIQLTQDWLKKNGSSVMRWGAWFELSRKAWAELFLGKAITDSWIPAYLNHRSDQLFWKREIWFDVGSDFNGSEIHLLKELSRENKIRVFCPKLSWQKQYSKSLWTYSLLMDVPSSSKSKVEETPPSPRGLTLKRFSTQVAEVKFVTALVRKWIEDKVPLEKIGVFSANVEEYWPVLYSYFKVEGIPVNKSHVAPAHSFPEISKWLSRLRLEVNRTEASDLEIQFYDKDAAPSVRYEKFKSLFSNLYEEKDIKRIPEITRSIKFTFSEDSLLTREHFIDWSLKFWSVDSPLQQLEPLMSKLLSECKLNTAMTLAAWVSYLDGLATLENNVEEINEEGVDFINFDAALSKEKTHRVMLGLSEKQLKSNNPLTLTISDVLNLNRDLGFYLDLPESDRLSFLANWITSQPAEVTALTVADSDFLGEPLAPALIWLKQLADRSEEEKSDISKLNGSTRWDEIHKFNHYNIIEKTSSKEEAFLDLEGQILKDLDMKANECYLPSKGVSLSASQLEKYAKCAFVFSAEKVFGLKDTPDVDLDMDRMAGGSLVHRLFELLTMPPTNLNKSDSEIREAIDQCRELDRVKFLDDNLWVYYKSKYFSLAKKFLEFEKSWKEQHPENQIHGCEVKVKGYWNTKKEGLDKESGELSFSGKIDRVDMGSGGAVAVIDYKNSKTKTVNNYKKWLEKDIYQLALYAMAVEDGLIDLSSDQKLKVVGAFYYVVKNWTRHTGFGQAEEGKSLFTLPKRAGSSISDNEKGELLRSLRAKINEQIKKIIAGEFTPKPKNTDDCKTCHWRSLCRAPHLI